MKLQYSQQQIESIRDQAYIYQCACPAQVCVAIDAIRDLHKQQLNCLNTTDTDIDVHNCIKEHAEKTHAELEQCLTSVLTIEGWDMTTLKMPTDLKKRLSDF